jgi:hypothetical protein
MTMPGVGPATVYSSLVDRLLRPEPLHQDVLAIANGAADLDVRWAVPAHSGLR